MSDKTYRKVLTIAGSDSGGGAGIQADLKTVSALGCYGSSVIVALTAQNTTSVTGIHQADPEFIRSQIQAVLEDIGADAVKIGMLFSPEVIQVVAEELERFNVKNVVLDPVMVAKSGDKLLQDEARDELVHRLFPLSSVVTPNVEEAKVILGREINSFDEMSDAGEEMLKTGAGAVLMKGGHLHSKDSSKDCLVSSKNGEIECHWFEGKRINTPNTHGTGCTYSSAIAAGLAKEKSLVEAVAEAKTYINEAIAAGVQYKIGEGHGPVHHFHKFW